MFEGFERRRIATGDAEINLVLGGEGPALLLLHGYPQTHVVWHAVAPLLGAHFSLVIPDLRGYGESVGPPPDPEHRNYCKRTMAMDMVSVMGELGHERFHLSRDTIEVLGSPIGSLSTILTGSCASRASIRFLPSTSGRRWIGDASIDAFHWPFLAQPAPIPERLIGKRSGLLPEPSPGVLGRETERPR